MIRLHTLGALDVTIDGAAAPADLLWKKNIGLLLYLARAPKHQALLAARLNGDLMHQVLHALTGVSATIVLKDSV